MRVVLSSVLPVSGLVFLPRSNHAWIEARSYLGENGIEGRESGYGGGERKKKKRDTKKDRDAHGFQRDAQRQVETHTYTHRNKQTHRETRRKI
jgi:hypothetical protein